MAIDKNKVVEELPEGFTLDSEEQVSTEESSLPEGFSVDTEVAVEEAPKQQALNQTAEVSRQAIGKVILAMQQPARISEQVAGGRLFKKDPLENTVGTLVESTINTAAFGVPKAIIKGALKQEGLDYPEAENKTADVAGKILGLIVPGKIATSVVTKIPGLAGRGIVKGMTQGALEGAAVGFTQSPDDFMDLQQRILQASGGAAFGTAAVPVARGLQNIARLGFQSSKFAQGVRQSLFESKRAIGQQFESQLDNLITNNPSKVVDLEDSFKRLKDLAKDNSRLVSDLKLGAKRAGLDVELIEGFIEKPESAKLLTLNQSRQIKQAVNNVPSVGTNLKKGKFGSFSETDIDLLDFADEVKGKQLASFPEMQKINSAYSDSMNKYNLVKDKFKVGKLLDNIEKNFGDKEIRDVVKELLPKKVIDDMGGYRAAAKTLKALGWISVVAGGAAVGGLVAGNRLLRGINSGN